MLILKVLVAFSLNSLLPPLMEDRHWVTQSRVPVELLSILPLPSNISKLHGKSHLSWSSPHPQLSLRSSLMPMHLRQRVGVGLSPAASPSPLADCLCHFLVQFKAPNAEAFLLVFILHTKTTADSVCLLFIGCTSQFSCPHPSLSHELSVKAHGKKVGCE